MNLNKSIDPQLEALLAEGRIIRRVPDVVRARALARARATIAAVPSFALARPATAPRFSLRIAVTATVALAAGAAGAAAALNHRVTVDPSTTPRPLGLREGRSERARSDGRASSALPSDSLDLTPRLEKTQRLTRSPTSQESYAAELELLQRAQAAFAKGDVAETLAVVARHAHRFPNGRLSEEREAFRIRSLVSSGQADEARRAVTTFARKFPRSVLLPRLQESASAAN